MIIRSVNGLVRRHHELADEEQHDQQGDAEAPAPVDELEFGFIQRLVLHVLYFFMEFNFFVFHFMLLYKNRLGTDHRRGHAMEESIGDEQTDPDDEAEEAHDIHNGKTADTFFLQLAEVGNHADAEEGEQEEDGTEAVDGTGHGTAQLVHFRGREAHDEQDEEGAEIAENEAGETIHHVAPAHGALTVGLVELGSPHVGKHEGPHADEHIDEDLDGGGHHHDPAGFVLGAETGNLGKNQGFGDGTGSNGAAVGLDGQAHPAAGHHGFAVQEVLSEERQNEHFNAGEHHDQGRNHDRDNRPGTDGTAGGDSGGHTADGNAGSQRSSPFLVELEVLTGDIVNHGPVKQISFNNGAEASEDDVTGETGGISSLHAEFGAQDDDGDLHEQFGTAGFTHAVGESGSQVADEDTGNQSADKTGFGAEAKSPRNAHLGELGGVGGDVGVGAHGVAGDGDEEDQREGTDKALHVAPHELHAHGENRSNEDVRDKKRSPTGHESLRRRRQTVKGVAHPHADLEGPAQNIQADQFAQCQNEDE